ncbi:hypothetical protein NN561_018743 [Cricetulus griseus]
MRRGAGRQWLPDWGRGVCARVRGGPCALPRRWACCNHSREIPTRLLGRSTSAREKKDAVVAPAPPPAHLTLQALSKEQGQPDPYEGL